MRKFFYTLSFLSVACLSNLNAQVCNPDPIYKDSAAGVYPKPEVDNIPTSNTGIYVPACVGKPYQFTLNLFVPDKMTFSGFTIGIKRLFLEANAVSGLPAGLNYGCNPDNCDFAANTVGCLSIYGTPTGAPGEYPLSIIAKVETEGLGIQNITFPNDNIAPGQYILRLHADGAVCNVGTVDIGAVSKLSLYPNPVYDKVIVTYDAIRGDKYDISIVDAQGKIVHAEKAQWLEGKHDQPIEASTLPAGYYNVRIVGSTGTAVLPFVKM